MNIRERPTSKVVTILIRSFFSMNRATEQAGKYPREVDEVLRPHDLVCVPVTSYRRHCPGKTRSGRPRRTTGREVGRFIEKFPRLISVLSGTNFKLSERTLLFSYIVFNINNSRVSEISVESKPSSSCFSALHN